MIQAGTTSTGGYGTYAMTAAGAWTYTLNNGNATVQALAALATLSDTFTVTTAADQAALDQIAAKGAQVVVVLSHNGMDVDLKMASRVAGVLPSSASCSPNNSTMMVLPTMFNKIPNRTKPINMVTAAITRPPKVSGNMSP